MDEWIILTITIRVEMPQTIEWYTSELKTAAMLDCAIGRSSNESSVQRSR